MKKLFALAILAVSMVLSCTELDDTKDEVFEIQEGTLTSYTMPADGGEISIPLTTNMDYKVVIPESADDWITIVETKSLRNETITLDIAENTTLEARSAEVKLTATDDRILETIAVSQDAKAVPTKKNLSILFVGNSLTQDGIAYLPYMLKNYYPEIDFKIYMWYIGGYTLEQQYENFAGNGKASIFSVAENSESWTNYSKSKTMKSVLSTYKFDIVCMQEYFNYKSSYTNVNDWNKCQSYIESNYTGGNSLEFICLFHAPLRSKAAEVFSMTETGNALILQTTSTTDMIPNGIAVYRALKSDLDALGDKQHLSPDGTHTQEGLPCLLQTYVTMCWLFDRLGINGTILNHPMRLTNEIYNKISVPGANLGTGVIQGTDAHYKLAQEIAIDAYKEGKEFVKLHRKQ